jgi:hypothetical protein
VLCGSLLQNTAKGGDLHRKVVGLDNPTWPSRCHQRFFRNRFARGRDQGDQHVGRPQP